MTTMTFAPMIALAVILIVAAGIFAFIVLRRGKMRRVKGSLVDPDKPTAEWLKREAKNARTTGGHPGK